MATYTLTRTPLFSFAEDAAVPTTTDTTVVTYTVPALTTAYIQGIVGTGTAAMRFKVKVDGTLKLVSRSTAAQTTVNPHLQDGAITATTGQVVIVQAYHEETANQTAQIALFGYTVS